MNVRHTKRRLGAVSGLLALMLAVAIPAGATVAPPEPIEEVADVASSTEIDEVTTEESSEVELDDPSPVAVDDQVVAEDVEISPVADPVVTGAVLAATSAASAPSITPFVLPAGQWTYVGRIENELGSNVFDGGKVIGWCTKDDHPGPYGAGFPNTNPYTNIVRVDAGEAFTPNPSTSVNGNGPLSNYVVPADKTGQLAYLAQQGESAVLAENDNEAAAYHFAINTLSVGGTFAVQNAAPASVKARAAELNAEARDYAGPYTARKPAIDMSALRVSNLGVVTSAAGERLDGYAWTATLSSPDGANPTWAATGTATLTGTSGSAVSAPISVSESGAVHVEITVRGLPATYVNVYQHPTAQDIFVGGNTGSVRSSADPVVYVADFQPGLTSSVLTKTVETGPLVDVLTVSAINGTTWVTPVNTGEYVPVLFEGAVYELGERPLREALSSVPEGLEPVATTSFTANGPGEYRVEVPGEFDPAFYTWVWSVVKANQPESTEGYIVGDWTDGFGIAAETVSVRIQAAVATEASSVAHEAGLGRDLLDTVTVSGFPADHGEFAGGAGFAADQVEMDLLLYFFPVGSEISDENLEAAELIGQATVPTTNGIHENVGDASFVTKVNEIGEPIAGTYVFVTDFAGDARVAPFRSSVTEESEQVIVTARAVSVTTKAQTEFEAPQVGDAIWDTVIVEGDILDGDYTVVDLFTWETGTEPVCETPVWTSERIELAPGQFEYATGTFVTVEAVDHGFVETTFNANGEIISQGACGEPDETVTITPRDITVTTQAQSDSQTPRVGDAIWDTVVIDGQVRPGDYTVVDLFTWEKGTEPVCETPVWTSENIELVEGTTEYATGTYVTATAREHGFVETTYDAEGEILSQGVCGEPDETVTVSARSASSGSAGLADTGLDGSILPLAGAALALTLGGIVLAATRSRGRHAA